MPSESRFGCLQGKQFGPATLTRAGPKVPLFIRPGVSGECRQQPPRRTSRPCSGVSETFGAALNIDERRVAPLLKRKTSTVKMTEAATLSGGGLGKLAIGWRVIRQYRGGALMPLAYRFLRSRPAAYPPRRAPSPASLASIIENGRLQLSLREKLETYSPTFDPPTPKAMMKITTATPRPMKISTYSHLIPFHTSHVPAFGGSGLPGRASGSPGPVLRSTPRSSSVSS